MHLPRVLELHAEHFRNRRRLRLELAARHKIAALNAFHPLLHVQDEVGKRIERDSRCNN